MSLLLLLSGSDSSSAPAPLSLPTGAEAIYATVRVNDWAGDCLRVIRASDTLEKDIGFGTDGFIDMADAVDFQGASTLSVVKWYDQSGNGRDCVDTTTLPRLRSENVMGTKQPITMIVSTGNAGAGRLTIPTSVSVSRQSYTCIAIQAPGGGVANTWGHFGLGTNATDNQNISVLYDNTSGAAGVQYTYDGAFNNNSRLNFSIPVGTPSLTMLWSDATNKLFRLNGREVSRAASTATTLAGGFIGRAPWSSAAIGTNEFFMLAVYNSVLSGAQRTSIESEAARVYNVNFNRQGIVVFDGDSITAGLNNAGFLLNLPRQTQQIRNDGHFYFDIAVSGQTMATINANKASATARYDSSLSFNNSHIFAGTNDLEGRASGTIVGFGTTIFNDRLLPYIQTMQSSNFTNVVVGTMLPRLWTGSGTDQTQKETERLAYNTLIRDNAATYGYIVADYASLWPTPSDYTGAGSVDGIHPTVASYTLMAAICDTALETAQTATAPNQVTGLVAIPEDSQASLYWTASNPKGSPITDYLVEYKLNSSGTWLTFSHSPSTDTDIVITGLTNGSLYDFRVSAINAIGTGTASATTSVTINAFVPTSIPDLELWLDASDTATITHVANAVSQWDDKSGNANHATQGTAANQPTTNTRTINGLNVIDFDGSNDLMSLTSGIDPAVAGVTIFHVVEPDVNTGTQTIVGSNTNGLNFGTAVVGSNVQNTAKSGVTGYLNGTQVIAAGTPFIGTCRTQASGTAHNYNGVNDNSNSTATSYTVNIDTIGNRALATSPFNGKMATILIFTRILNTVELNIVGNYLSDIWGISWTNVT